MNILPDIRVMVGMASIPEREEALRMSVASLAPQADRLVVTLNGYEDAPAWLAHHPNVEAHLLPLGENGGDAEKFAAVDGWDGYAATCDDDVLYPPDYIQTLVDGIDRYDRQRLVGFHGGTTAGWNGSHGAATLKRIRCLGHLYRDDETVNVLGTGTLGWHASTLPLYRDAFPTENMADVHLACHAHRLGLPMVALAHERGWLTDICPPESPRIFESNRAGDGSSRDTRERRRLELDLISWGAPLGRPRIRVSITTCERPALLANLLEDVARESGWCDLQVAVYEDPSAADYGVSQQFAADHGWTWHTMEERCGRSGYWRIVDRQHRDAGASEAEWFVFLPDDVRLVRHALARAISAWTRLVDPVALTLWRLKDHEDTGSWTGMFPTDRGHAFETGFVDGNLLCRRELLEFFEFGMAEPYRRRSARARSPLNAATSSGVGRSMSIALFRAGKRMYRVPRSLAAPVVPDPPSIMNPDAADRRFPGVAL